MRTAGMTTYAPKKKTKKRIIKSQLPHKPSSNLMSSKGY